MICRSDVEGGMVGVVALHISVGIWWAVPTARIDRSLTVAARIGRRLGVAILLTAGRAVADSAFAAGVVDYSPSPGHFVNNATFSDPARALGAPSGGGLSNGNNLSVVSLGGFGGSITLAFDHTVEDHRANPLGLDAIVFGNAFWVGRHPNRHWAECGHIEISLDENENGVADDRWYLIPGSHILSGGQLETQTWDADVADPTFPPSNPTWIPPEYAGFERTWSTAAYRLPPAIFDTQIIVNPLGLTAGAEGIFGYADFAPTLLLGDLDADDAVDDANVSVEDFYTVPDNPFTVGIDAGTGGGDAFDIAWAVDPQTWLPADLPGFDFIRITNGVNYLAGNVDEVSTEIDAVADVRPGLLGDADADLDVDAWDYEAFDACQQDSLFGRITPLCRVMDFDDDGRLTVLDFGGFQNAFNGEL